MERPRTERLPAGIVLQTTKPIGNHKYAVAPRRHPNGCRTIVTAPDLARRLVGEGYPRVSVQA